MFKNYDPSSCAILLKWTNLKIIQRPLWRTFNIPKLFLEPKIEDRGSKRKPTERMPISVDILWLPRILRTLKVPLCKILRQTNN